MSQFDIDEIYQMEWNEDVIGFQQNQYCLQKQYNKNQNKCFQPTLNTTNQVSNNQKIAKKKILKYERQKRKIQCSANKIVQYTRIFRGVKNQTIQLNTNFKTIIKNFVKDLILVKQLDKKQLEITQKFTNENPSFQSFVNFFYSPQLKQKTRQKCFQLFSSTEIMKKILLSRAKPINKSRMIKLVQIARLNLNCNGNILKWKSNRNPFTKDDLKDI